MKVKIVNKSQYPNPQRQSEGSSGLDVYANIEEPVLLENGKIEIIPTGIFLEIPPGIECQVRARSGLAAKHGITLVNGIGTIDSDYRGEIKVILSNLSDKAYTIQPGDRIAQLIFAPILIPEIEYSVDIETLSTTGRGSGGFGHTG